MRPSKQHRDADVYECTDCGERVTSPETRVCDCGGEFMSLGKSRDL